MNRLKLFVGNLPSDTSEQDLRTLFEPYGDVREVHIMSSARSRLGFACAFVVFGQGDKVEEAIEALNGKHRFSADSEAITVSFARAEEPKKARQAETWNQDQASQMWQYQQYYAAQLAMMQAYGMWGAYGGYNPYQNAQGYGMSSEMLGGGYPSGFEMPDSSSMQPGERLKPPPGVGAASKDSEDAKLFLGGLPAGVTESEIRTVFSQVGTVKEVHIMHGKSQSGQACAFVVYPDLYSAQLAIRTLNKTPWHSAPDQPPIIVRAADKVQKKKGGAKEVSAAMLKED